MNRARGGRGVSRGLHQGQRPSPEGTGDIAEKSNALRGRWGRSRGIQGLSKRQGHGPFLNRNVQLASKSYLVSRRAKGRPCWVGADSFLLSHCLSEKGSERGAPCAQPTGCLRPVVPTEILPAEGDCHSEGPLCSCFPVKTAPLTGPRQRALVGGVSASGCHARCQGCGWTRTLVVSD